MRLVQQRREGTRTGHLHAIQRGIDASLSAGTTLLGDISSGGQSWMPLLRSPLRATVFAELIGLRPARAVETATAARQFLEWCGGAAGTPDMTTDSEPAQESLAFEDGPELLAFPALAATGDTERLIASVSPHAPYSTHPLLYELASRWQGFAPLATHLAETPEELRLLEHQNGPLRKFLQEIGAWDESWKPLGSSPMDYITGPAARRRQWLIAHGNCLSEAEIHRLAPAGSAIAACCGRCDAEPGRVAVAYCPRTHFFFGRPQHPYAQMLKAGVPVCLGTDSLASTSSLSVLDEMRFLHRRDGSLDGQSILRMATLAGAIALGRESSLGSIAPGKFADFAVVGLPDRDESDPHLLVLESDLPVVRTVIGGRTVFQRRA
jgi:cytosine/adenosine deaminase-related metal-dependent hydrolase